MNTIIRDNIQELLDKREDRRSELWGLMQKLNAKQFSCMSCSGICCTSIANSMQIDLVQAVELYVYLVRKGKFSESSLKENVEEFRLTPLSTGKGGQTFRKRYTCPFYKGSSLGCDVSPRSKPYGCLGFNAIGENVSAGENCRSYTETLEGRDERMSDAEKLENQWVAAEFKLINDKQAIPIKLLEVHAAFKSHFTKEEIQSFQ